MADIDLNAEMPIEQLELDFNPEQRAAYRKFYETPVEPEESEAE